MIIHDQVLDFCFERKISQEYLEEMVRLSTPHKHLWANRRYKSWVFDADMGDGVEDEIVVYKMGVYCINER